MRKEAVVVSWLGWMRVADSCTRVVGATEESCLAFKEGHSLGEERKHQADYLGWAEMGERACWVGGTAGAEVWRWGSSMGPWMWWFL